MEIGKSGPDPRLPRLRSSLKAKIILISVATMFLGIGASTLMSRHLFKKEVTQSLESQALAVATGLKLQLEHQVWAGVPVSQLTGFDKECLKIYLTYPDIAYAMVLDPSGTILFHYDPSLRGIPITNPGVRNALRSADDTVSEIVQNRRRYRDAMVHVRNASGKRVAVVRVGFPTAVIARKTKTMVLYAVGIAVVCFGLSIAAIILALSAWISVPLRRFLTAVEEIRTKEKEKIDITSRDELGELAAAFNAMIRDLRETTVSKDLLHESEEKYRNLVEQSLVGVYIIRDGLFRFVNARLCDIFGYEREELVGKIGPLDITHPDDRPLMEAKIHQRLSGDIQSVEYEFRGVRKSGEVFPVKVYGSAARIAGHPAIVGTFLDLSREKHLEAQLLHSRKMEAVGRVAGGIAHDINNSLGAIMAYCELAKLRAEGLPDLTRDLDSAIEVSGKASMLIRQVLAFSKLQPVNPVLVNLNDLVDRMGKMMESLVGENIAFERNLEEDLWDVRIDPLQVEQILYNLAINAKDAIAEMGRLTIATRNEVFAAADPGCAKPGRGKHVVLSVTDTGAGISDDIRGYIFDPFFTTKEEGKGSGLGLSTVYGIVQQNGGWISVESEPGLGTTFKIFLPAAEREGLPARPPSIPVFPSEGRPLGILLVDDNEELRTVVGTLLEKTGFRVTVAPDAAAGLEVFRSGAEPVDIVVTDIVMPGTSGKELAQRIRSERKDAKVVFISGYTDEILDSEDLADENTRFLKKPFPIGALIEMVSELTGARLN